MSILKKKLNVIVFFVIGILYCYIGNWIVIWEYRLLKFWFSFYNVCIDFWFNMLNIENIKNNKFEFVIYKYERVI